MARRLARRASHTRSRPKPLNYLCEALEPRQLLTTLHGGDTFQFKSGNTLALMIVQGSPLTTVEVSAQGPGAAGPAAINMPGVILNAGGATLVAGGIPMTDGPFLWNIYVSNSDMSTSITTYAINPQTGRPEPFMGSASSPPYYDMVTPTQFQPPPYTPMGPSGTGPITLGLPGDNAVPIDSTVNGPLATIPSTLTTLAPGLIVAAGHNLGTFEFAGLVAGQVNIHGSCDLFYAGWLLTGQATGVPAIPSPSLFPHNFNVDGDLHTLIVKGDIGTDAEGTAVNDQIKYFTAFDMHVGGRLGEIKTLGNLVGTVNVDANPSVPSLGGTVNETETRLITDLPNTPAGGDPIQRNDTYNTAQFLGATDTSGVASVNGELDAVAPINDFVDYYAVPLMAGQTITVKLTEIGEVTLVLDVGVFDPDGRIVASDFNSTDPLSVQNQTFQFTPDRPGFYRFAVGEAVNPTFVAAPGSRIGGTFPYNLQITGVGNLAWGALNTAGEVVDNSNLIANATGGGPVGSIAAGVPASFHLTTGDMGGIEAIGPIVSSAGGVNTIMVDNGDLRAVDGAALGKGVADETNGVEGYVPNGSVGLLRSTAGVLEWNQFQADASYGTTQGIIPQLAAPQAIGGNYQLVASAANLEAGLIANGGIGVIRANACESGVFVSVFDVNADNSPNGDGIIDLIDINGQLGTLGLGGPKIRTGPGGNVRYFHVARSAVTGNLFFADAFFGGGGGGPVNQYQPGEAVPMVDDSGARVQITPLGVENNPNFDPTLPAGPNNPQTDPGTLTIANYGIEGSGGSAIVNISSTTGVTVGVGGDSPAQSAEIGEIDANGPGTAVVTAPTPVPPIVTLTGPGPGQPGGPPVITQGRSRLPTLPNPPILSTAAGSQQLEVGITGRQRGDVWLVNGGQFTSIHNDTPGEIANVTATSIGTLSSGGSIGLTSDQHTPEVIQGQVILSDAQPFSQQRNLIQVSGSVVTISAPQIGNILVNGDIGSAAGTISAPLVANGSIQSVNYGNGVAPIGSGAFSRAGIFAGGVLGTVTGNNADIRGAIEAVQGIVGIGVHNGSIIGANIGNYANFASATLYPFAATLVSVVSPVHNPLLQIGSISVSGNGGIIGTDISADHLGPVNVNGGFGIFDSLFATVGEGTFQSISTDGYGIRGDLVNIGALGGTVLARGNGSNVPVTNYSPSVRLSENGSTFDPFTGLLHNRMNDLDVYLGTSAANPQILMTTDTGVIEDSTFTGSANVNNFDAWSIRGTSKSGLQAPIGLTVPGMTVLNVANQIGTIHTTGPIAGLQVVSGRVRNFVPNGDVSALDMEISGSINRAVFNSSLNAGSVIFAKGPNGHIGTITIHGSMNGTIRAFTRIANLIIDGSLTGLVKANTLGSLKLGGGMGDGSLEIDGNVGTIQTAGDLGSAGNTLTINGTLKALKVGGNLNANVTVGGNTGLIQVGGSIISNTTTTVNGVLTTLKVAHDIQVGAIVKAHLIKKRIIGGQVLGTLTTF